MFSYMLHIIACDVVIMWHPASIVICSHAAIFWRLVNGLLFNGFNGHSVKSSCERRMPLVYYSSALATLALFIIRRGIMSVTKFVSWWSSASSAGHFINSYVSTWLHGRWSRWYLCGNLHELKLNLNFGLIQWMTLLFGLVFRWV